MLSEEGYEYLKSLLGKGKIVFPERAVFMFSEDFIAAHLKCHQTAMQVAVESGFPPVVGIQFIDLNGKLYPWPHMVNRRQDALIHCSPRPSEPVLGFIETSWEELPQWRQIVVEYNDLASHVDKPHWGDPYADLLTAEFMAPIRASLQAAAPQIV
jgi:hypothetical protein